MVKKYCLSNQAVPSSNCSLIIGLPILLFGLALFFFVTGCEQSHSQDRLNVELIAFLDSLAGIDQTVERMPYNGFGGMNVPEYFNYMDSVKYLHSLQVDSIFKIYGYPKLSMLGTEGTQDFFILVMHINVDTALQRLAFESLTENLSNSEGDSTQYAYLYDMVRRKKGLPQKFGTQYQRDRATRKMVLYPIEGLDNIDSLRMAYGLDSLKSQESVEVVKNVK